MCSILMTLWLTLADLVAGKAPPRRRPAYRRPLLEALEDRTVPSNFTAATVTDLINDINAANLAGGSNTIALVAGNTFTLTAVNNSTDGGNGLPVIAANDNLTIQGNGDTIDAARFGRLFDIALGASLTLANMTLQGGSGYGDGGAICNQGTLDLKGVTVQNNTCSGQLEPADGGGIYSSGSLTLEAGTVIRGNQAVGGSGQAYWNYNGYLIGYSGGPAYGGGLYVAGGTATLTNVTLSSNIAQGGNGVLLLPGPSRALPGGDGEGGGLYVAAGTVALTDVTLSSNSALGGAGSAAPFGSIGPAYGGRGGAGEGGGLYVAGGTVTLRSDIVTGNSALGGAGGTGSAKRYDGSTGWAGGGGLYIDSAATVYLDAFTLHNTKQNKPDNIEGTYILI